MLTPANGWLAVFQDHETEQMWYAPLVCWLQTGNNVVGHSRPRPNRTIGADVIGGLQPAFQLTTDFQGYVYRPRLWSTLAAMHASLLPMANEDLPGEDWESA